MAASAVERPTGTRAALATVHSMNEDSPTLPERSWGFRTRAIHAGARPEPTTGAGRCRSSRRPASCSRDTADAADLFALQKFGNIYSRISNPTVAAFEERIASLEGGIGAVATASGQSAEFLAIAALCEAGDHIVSSAQLYGGTRTLLEGTLARFGVDDHVRRRRSGRRLRRGAAAQHQADLHRGGRQPVGRRRRPRGPRRGRPRRRHPAGRRLDRRDAVPVPADRVGRRHRRPLGHEVPRRPRHLARRGGRRIRVGSTGATATSRG